MFFQNRYEWLKLQQYGVAAFFSRWFFLSFIWLFLSYNQVVFSFIAPIVDTRFFIQHFQGKLYHPYAIYFLDYYWLAFTLAGPLYFYQFRERFTIENDKYQALFCFLFKPFFSRLNIRVAWSPLVRLGLLTVLLKLFFVPYVITWCVDNFLNLYASFESSIWQWDFKAWTIFLIRACLLIDVCVFAFSYMIESSRLKSDIKSVDPSPLAWLVCLACYPPFNSLIFPYFDVALFSISVEVNNTVGFVFNGIEVLLWMIFAWASITLGFKASNLTARGVVKKGPYRWVRHPAYSAKLAVWWVQGIIFADFSVGILLAFTVIYVMRAWTEERHLLFVDPEYKEYCKQVRWRFLPGVI